MRDGREDRAADDDGAEGQRMSERSVATAAPHPDEMRVEVELRTGRATVLRASARTTPAGLVSVGILVSAILLSTAVLVRAAIARPR